eukprot:15022205-Heterocapsa_arctica.AAC.1
MQVMLAAVAEAEAAIMVMNFTQSNMRYLSVDKEAEERQRQVKETQKIAHEKATKLQKEGK